MLEHKETWPPSFSNDLSDVLNNINIVLSNYSEKDAQGCSQAASNWPKINEYQELTN